MLKKVLSLLVIVCFFLTTLGPIPKAHAGTVLGLPAPGTMVNLSPAYEPVMIKGLTVHKDNPFLFDFIVDVGQDNMSGEPLKKEGEKLIKYFMASLAIPDKDAWVNLSPYEKNKIIPDALGQTDMGRDLLEQDYMLKQITASLIYPEKDLGKKFWDKVYSKAQQMYGTTQIPVNTFNKVWITADRAEVFEHDQTVFVVDSHLKVMLEEDYLAMSKRRAQASSTLQENNPHALASQIIRNIILPELEKEVNTGKNFANLRQIFNSIILSSWYKRDLKAALLNQVYTNQSKIKGINLNDPAIKERIYEQYLKAYKKGVFNYIKEDINTVSGQSFPRKYFSGGIDKGMAANPTTIFDVGRLADSLPKNRAMVSLLTFFEDNTNRALIAKSPYGDINILFNRQTSADNNINVEISIGDLIIEKEGFWPDPPPLHILASEIGRRVQMALASPKAIGLNRTQLKRFIEANVSVNLDEAMSVNNYYHRHRADMEYARRGVYSFRKRGPKSSSKMGKPQRLSLQKRQPQILNGPNIFITQIEEYLASQGRSITSGLIKEFLDELRLSPVSPDLVPPGSSIFTSLTSAGTIPIENARELVSKGSAGIFLLEDRGYYLIQMPNAAMTSIVTQEPNADGLHITPELARAFDKKIGHFTTTGRPGAGKDQLMNAFIAKMNKILPPDKQIESVILGDYFRGITRLVLGPVDRSKFLKFVGTILDPNNENTVWDEDPTEGKVRLKSNIELTEDDIRRLLIENNFTESDFNEIGPTLEKAIKYKIQDGDDEKYSQYVQYLRIKDIDDMNSGGLIEDPTAFRIINKILKEPRIVNAKHIFFNGFPRTIPQWQALRNKRTFFIAGKPLDISLFVDIHLPVEETFVRAQRRSRGDDDLLEAVKKRQNQFDKETSPMVLDIERQNPRKFVRISSYYPHDTFQESVRKTNEHFISTLARFLKVHVGTAIPIGRMMTDTRSVTRMIANTVQSVPVVTISGSHKEGEEQVRVLALNAEPVNRKQQIIMQALIEQFNNRPSGAYTLNIVGNGVDWGVIYKQGINKDGFVGVAHDLVVWLNQNLEMTAMIQSIFAKFGDNDPEEISIDDSLAWLGVDELNLKSLKEELEVVFKLKISYRDAEEWETVRDLIDYVQNKANAPMNSNLTTPFQPAERETQKRNRQIRIKTGKNREQRRLALKEATYEDGATKGGIDLNTSNGMQWKDSKDGNGVEMNIDTAMIARIKRDGIDSLSPVVFKITPIVSIWPIVGLHAPVQEEAVAGV